MPELSTGDLLRRHARPAVIGAVLVAVVVVGLSLIGKREWASSSSFLPQSRRAQGGLSALAAQFGVTAPNLEGQPTPQFYADLLSSREFLYQLVLAKLDTGRGPNVRLIQVLNVSAPDSARAAESAIRLLTSRVEAEVGPKTGLVTLRTRMSSPRLAYEVNRFLIDMLVRFNLETRQSQAGAERRFTESRLSEASAQLRVAEERQRDFSQRNRMFVGSPELSLERERLSREVAMRQQLYSTLLQSYEQARIDEVRDTPTITIVENPRVPALPLSRHVAIRGILGLLIGAILGVVWSVWRAWRRSEAPTAY